MDIASNDLNAVTLPIPSEKRIFVFLASGHDPAMESKWLSCGGITTFMTDSPEACGICIFRRGFGSVHSILPFFDRAGKEANVFAFDWQDQTFRRIDRNWIEVYSTVEST